MDDAITRLQTDVENYERTRRYCLLGREHEKLAAVELDRSLDMPRLKELSIMEARARESVVESGRELAELLRNGQRDACRLLLEFVSWFDCRDARKGLELWPALSATLETLDVSREEIPPVESTEVKMSNHDRDQWMLEQWNEGKTLSWIKGNISKQYDQLYSEQAVQQAIKAHAERWTLHCRKGKPGRPKKST